MATTVFGFTITGVPALLIILLILVLIVWGAVSMFRAGARGAKKITGSDPD